MSGRWIPPHKRPGFSNPTSSLASPTSSSRAYSIPQISNQFGNTTVGTLNADALDPSKLSRILVFEGQHPEWPPTIFCKTNLELLPKPEAAINASSPTTTSQDVRLEPREEVASHEPFSLFTPAPRTSVQNFEFAGWYRVVRVKLLEARSKELVEMLERKWTRKGGKSRGRSAESWKESLGMDWALVSLEKLPEQEQNERGNPMDPLKELPTAPQLSVSEQLEQLRLKDKGSAEMSVTSHPNRDGSEHAEAHEGKLEDSTISLISAGGQSEAWSVVSTGEMEGSFTDAGDVLEEKA